MKNFKFCVIARVRDMKLSEFFEAAKTKDIVINSDIDGFLSGMILQKYYDCRIVGFSNSKESIWLIPEIDSIYEPVYIDIYVNRPDTFCIDQHVIAHDNNHLERILSYGTKMNPNLDIFKRSYRGDYYHKYPFGTVHYLIALMKQDGIDVQFNDLEMEYTVKGADGRKYKTCPGQIILRADDALYSSLGPYEGNARNWWEKLKKFNSNSIDSLYKYLFETCDKKENWNYKNDIGEFFIKGLNCDGSDGAFNRITCSDGKTVEDRVINYNNIINKIVGIEMELPHEVKEYKGSAQRGAFSVEKLQSAITYAFICSPKKPNQCFSYTIDIG